MGKSKKRIFNRNSENKGIIIKRQNIISQVLSDVRNNKLDDKSKNFISLFGISMEELAESGATIEELSIIKSIVF